MKALLAAGLAGLLFGAGLFVGQMTVPAKVMGFLNFFGDWDPTLVWVMLGAIVVHLPLRIWLVRRGHPAYATSFSTPPPSRLDGKLILGAAIFGIGWGTAGYCPGPAIANSATSVAGGIALSSMLIGILLHDVLMAKRQQECSLRAPALPNEAQPVRLEEWCNTNDERFG